MAQKRPFLIRLAPPGLRLSLLDRYYRARRDRWRALYQDSPLLAAPNVSMQLVPGDRLSDVVAFTGSYEHELTRRVVELGLRGGTMIDVGANLGYFTLLWLAANSSNRCIAFEAVPRNVEILRSNISRNGLDEKIRIIPSAASDRSGKVFFDLGPDDQRGWGGISLDNLNGRSIEVQAVRIDEAVPQDQHISLLKVDTEGADTLVLKGCERLLKKGLIGEIWYEQNKPRMRQIGVPLDAAQNYLESVDYDCTAHGSESNELVEWSATRRRRLHSA